MRKKIGRLYPDLATIKQSKKDAPTAKQDRAGKDARHSDPKPEHSKQREKANGADAVSDLPPVPPGQVRYRIAVGKIHDVGPKHIVGTIANEAGLDSEYIGQIKIFDDYSLVDLPEGMPKDLFQHLRKVRTCGQRLELEVFGQNSRPKKRAAKKARPKKRHKDKRKAK